MHNLTKFPYFKQFGNLDCGPTCLRIVARYYGKTYSEDSLRKLIGKPQGRLTIVLNFFILVGAGYRIGTIELMEICWFRATYSLKSNGR